MHLITHSRTTLTRTLPWISDAEVRRIFKGHRCFYTVTNGNRRMEGDGIFIREQRSREGTLGYVLESPIDGIRWLWVISKKTRHPFALARVN